MKILCFNVPTTGHVNPTLPVTAELVRRGHDVIYYLSEGYRQKIEATGATFRAYETIPDDYFERRGLDGSHPARTALALLATCQEIVPGLVETVRAEQPDAVMHDSMCPWGWMAAQIAGAPTVSSTTLLILTPAQMVRAAGALPMLRLGAKMLPQVRQFQPEARKAERRFGVKVPGFVDFMNALGMITISYTSALFQPHAERLSPSIKFVGPPVQRRQDRGDFPFEALDGRPLIYISLGTVINDNPAFFLECLEAFRGSGQQVVMSVGKRIETAALGGIPDNFIVRRYAPQLDVLQRAALFITHGGMNSVHEGLYYDVPLVLVPQQMEQRVVTLRVEDLGAGVMLRRQTAETIRQAAERVLGDGRFRDAARRIGASLRKAGGHCRAADEIEALRR